MAHEIPHPLETWLRAHGITAFAFARTHNMKWRTLYNQLNGLPEQPRFKIMKEIQKATKGDVTAEMQSDWFMRRSK